MVGRGIGRGGRGDVGGVGGRRRRRATWSCGGGCGGGSGSVARFWESVEGLGFGE